MDKFLAQKRNDLAQGRMVALVIFSILVGLLVLVPSGLWTAIVTVPAVFLGFVLVISFWKGLPGG